jgi:hypothetical protein
MKTSLFAGIAAIALSVLPLQAAAQSTSQSVGGSIDSVGSMTSFSVFLGGTGTASVNINQDDFSFTQIGNAAPVIGGGGFGTSGSLNVAPGVDGYVNVQRNIAPSRAAPITIDTNSGFNIPSTFGAVNVTARSAPTFQPPAIQMPNFSSGFQAPSFSSGFQAPSFNFGGGFFSN